jgi:hypothetical protein
MTTRQGRLNMDAEPDRAFTPSAKFHEMQQ